MWCTPAFRTTKGQKHVSTFSSHASQLLAPKGYSCGLLDSADRFDTRHGATFFEKRWSHVFEAHRARKMSVGARNSQSPMLLYRSWFRVSNKPFSIDFKLLAGSAVVQLCASGGIFHGVVLLLCRFSLTGQVASRAGFWYLRAARCPLERKSRDVA